MRVANGTFSVLSGKIEHFALPRAIIRLSIPRNPLKPFVDYPHDSVLVSSMMGTIGSPWRLMRIEKRIAIDDSRTSLGKSRLHKFSFERSPKHSPRTTNGNASKQNVPNCRTTCDRPRSRAHFFLTRIRIRDISRCLIAP